MSAAKQIALAVVAAVLLATVARLSGGGRVHGHHAAPPDDLPEIDWLAVEDPEEAAEAAAAAAEAAGDAGTADGDGGDTPGSKSNAARNKKKREKEKAKRLAAQEAAGAST